MNETTDPYYVAPGPLVVDVVELVPEIDVQAFEMTDTTFKYRCKCKKGFHLHGNGGDPFSNRVESRSSHCPEFDGEVNIHITDNTTRKLRQTKSASK